MRIKEGDQVEVISGNDKGLRGTVLRVESKGDKVVNLRRQFMFQT